MPDLERLAGRAAARNASPDDLRTLAELPLLLTQGRAELCGARTGFLRALGRERPALAAFATQAGRILAEAEAPHLFRRGASPMLDQALAQIEAAEAWRNQHLEQLRQQPGLDRVRLERNNTQGLFLEVPANTRVPTNWTRRGGLQKVERYITAELEQHAITLAEAEAEVTSETRVLLAHLRDMAAACAGDARDLRASRPRRVRGVCGDEALGAEHLRE